MIENDYIASVKKQFSQYRILGEKAMEQVPEEMMDWQYNPESNSIATLVKHMAGNMLSRFTNFLTSDGEKEWRNRDAEFENEKLSRNQLTTLWDEGWNCLFDMLNALTPEDLSKTIRIRNENHTVVEAIHRQLTHYASHVGQILFISKMICGSNWKSPSISRGASREFNATKGL